MADKLGVSQKQYSHFENANSNLEWRTLEKIALALDIDIIKLVSFNEEQIFNNCNNLENIVSAAFHSIDKEVIVELRNQLKEKDEQIRILLTKLE